MSFTSVETVRKHILEKHLGINTIESESLRLNAENYAGVAFPPIQKDSVTVKALTQNQPESQNICFVSGDQVTLNKKPIARDTIVIASDSSLGTVYRENVDYLVDYGTGTITRIGGGIITAAQSLVIWFLPYRIYTPDIDYRIDYAGGRISRIADGAIFSGQEIEIDYISEFGIVDDNVIVNAIDEANESVLNYIDSAYVDSTDRSLVIGETYLAIAIVCRIKAVESISSGISGNPKSSWLALAEQYKIEAYSFLEKFAASAGNFSAPKKA